MLLSTNVSSNLVLVHIILFSILILIGGYYSLFNNYKNTSIHMDNNHVWENFVEVTNIVREATDFDLDQRMPNLCEGVIRIVLTEITGGDTGLSIENSINLITQVSYRGMTNRGGLLYQQLNEEGTRCDLTTQLHFINEPQKQYVQQFLPNFQNLDLSTYYTQKFVRQNSIVTIVRVPFWGLKRSLLPTTGTRIDHGGVISNSGNDLILLEEFYQSLNLLGDTARNREEVIGSNVFKILRKSHLKILLKFDITYNELVEETRVPCDEDLIQMALNSRDTGSFSEYNSKPLSLLNINPPR